LRIIGKAKSCKEDVSTTSEGCPADTTGSFTLEIGTLSLLECLLSVTNAIKIAAAFPTTLGQAYQG